MILDDEASPVLKTDLTTSVSSPSVTRSPTQLENANEPLPPPYTPRSPQNQQFPWRNTVSASGSSGPGYVASNAEGEPLLVRRRKRVERRVRKRFLFTFIVAAAIIAVVIIISPHDKPPKVLAPASSFGMKY